MRADQMPTEQPDSLAITPQQAAAEIQRRHTKPLHEIDIDGDYAPPPVEDAADWYLARVMADHINQGRLRNLTYDEMP